MAGPASLEAQSVGGSGRWDYQISRTKTQAATQSSQQFNQNYQLNSAAPVTPLLNYRFSLRSNLQDQSLQTGGEHQSSSTRTLEPALDLSLSNPAFTWSGGVRWTGNDQDSQPGESTQTNTTNLYNRFDWRVENLPTLSLQADQQRVTGSQQDSTQNHYYFGTTYSLQSFSFLYNANLTDRKNALGGTTSSTASTLGSLSFQQTFWDNRISTFASYTQGLNRRTQETGGATRSDTNSINFNGTFQPLQRVSLSYNFLHSLITSEPPDSKVTTDNQGLVLFFVPHRLVNTNLSFNRASTGGGGVPVTTTSSYTFSANSNPLPTLSASFSTSFSSTIQGGTQSTESLSGVLGATGDLYPRTRGGMDLSFSSSKSPPQGTATETRGITWRVDTYLRDDLSFTGNYTVTWQTTRGGTSAGSRIIGSGGTILVYQPSRILRGRVELRFGQGTGASPTTQVYTLDWLPFPDGRMTFNLSYSTTPATATQPASTDALTGLRWNISDYFDAVADYTTSRRGGGAGTTDGIHFSLSGRF